MAQIQRITDALIDNGVSPTRIWTLGDCSYGNQAMGKALRHLGGFYLLGVPKSRQVELFGGQTSLGQYFVFLPDQVLTVARRRYRYKLSAANLHGWCRWRLSAIYGSKGHWRYYACNKLKCRAKTLLLRHRDRWAIEKTHRSLKNYHGYEHFHVWRKPAVLGHFQLAYVICELASLERIWRRQQGVHCTQELLHREALRIHSVNSTGGLLLS